MIGDGFDNKANDHTKEEREVQLVTTTLTNLLDQFHAPKGIDYLSLDVEGAEAFVLEGLNPSSYTFLALTIERPKPHSHHLLSKRGYRFLYQLDWYGECIYLHESKDNFAALMEKYRQKTVPVWPVWLVESSEKWTMEKRPYVLLPEWNEKYNPKDEQF